MISANKVVLIVEDDPAIAELIKYSLRGEAWHCCNVSSVEHALDFLQYHRPHLVLLDWMLRQENGLRVLSRIRQEPELHDVPVMLLTARTLAEDERIGRDSGADDYLTKPFSPMVLCARAKALMAHGIAARGSTAG
jgi:two-component system phosphate regulon response regulator PhoB